MFSTRLKELRIKKQISQSDLALELNLSNRTISMYEQGNSEPNVETLIRIANYFDVTTDFLVGLTDVKTTNLDISYMANYLGLNENTISSLHSFIQRFMDGDKQAGQKIDTLNMLFSSQCKLLDHMNEYFHFYATHLEYLENKTTEIPISILEPQDKDSLPNYPGDYDLWSKALLLIIGDDLAELRKKYIEEKYPFKIAPTNE